MPGYSALTEPIAFRASLALKRQAKAIAKREGVTLSDICVFSLQRYIALARNGKGGNMNNEKELPQ